MIIFAIMGESGCGKDWLAKELAAARPDLFHYIVSTTSRPIREGEVNGVDYHYINRLEFIAAEDEDEFLESTCFNGWYYGTRKKDLREDKINIGVFNPTGVRTLQKRKDITLVTYRLTCSSKQRLLRQLNREEHPNVDEIVRRYSTDNFDFANLNDIEYISLPNEKWEDTPPNQNFIIKQAEDYLGQIL